MRRPAALIACLAIACSRGDQGRSLPSDGANAAVDSAFTDPAPRSAAIARAAAGDEPPQDSGALVRPLVGHDEDVTAVAVSPDGRWIASGAEDGAIFLWDVESGARVRELMGHRRAVISLTFSPGGDRLVSTSDDRTARVWRVADGSQERVLGERLRNAGAAFSPDGSMLATGVSADRETHLWDPATGDALGELSHLHGGGRIAFSPDGRQLLMRLSDGVMAWDPRERRALWQVTGQWGGSGVAVDPTGTLLAYDARTHVALVDVPGQRLLDTLSTPVGAGHLAFAPSGELVMASGRSIRVWDVETRTEIASISGAMGSVSALTLSPDGALLVAGSRDGAVWIWDFAGALRASELGMMPWDLWDGPVPRGVGIHCDRRYGPGGVVAGFVLDSLDAWPVDSAEVTINGCRVDTDPLGNFLLVGIDPGSRLLTVSKPGWQGRSAQIEARVGDTTRVIIQIPPKARCDPLRHPELPRVESDGDVISLRLDDPLQAALDSVAPGFVPFGLDAYEHWIASNYPLQCYQAPSAVLADFNGDDRIDLAAAGRSGDEMVDVVLMSSADGYFVARGGRGSGTLGTSNRISYYARQDPGRITSPMEPDSLVLANYALQQITGEKSSSILYWLDGRWLLYVTGD